jgi:hypothetical protein
LLIYLMLLKGVKIEPPARLAVGAERRHGSTELDKLAIAVEPRLLMLLAERRSP